VKTVFAKIFMWIAACFFCCSSSEDDEPVKEPVDQDEFYFGADLSYVNQVLDHGGLYKESGTITDPYAIFKEKGTSLVRLRLWHNPTWTEEVYGDQGTQLYNDLLDVEKSIYRAKAEGMKVLLDFHYSDTWADPGHQDVPAAWMAISSVDALVDSVYNYTLATLNHLKSKNLLPEFVQIGNETNCGMMFSNALESFPKLNVCDGNWVNYGKVVNAGINAVRDASEDSPVKTKVILHVADPKNVEWWFDGITGSGGVSDFDIVGFSYYPLWHTTVSIAGLSDKVSFFKGRYTKDVMILETAYPWTTEGNDSYDNSFGSEAAIAGYPKTTEGQYEMLVKMTEEVKAGGGLGIIYWEPAWISSNLKDLWGSGSSWENCAFFDFEGNALKAFDYMKFIYE
jgi:arabinogalactan endo-1,4-beta-galactosidase